MRTLNVAGNPAPGVRPAMVSDDPTAAYARAFVACNAAHEELVRITLAAQTWAARLNETPTPHVAGTPVDMPFRSSRPLQAKDWPSATAIAEAVLARHRTAEAPGIGDRRRAKRF